MSDVQTRQANHANLVRRTLDIAKTLRAMRIELRSLNASAREDNHLKIGHTADVAAENLTDIIDALEAL
jgi:hypothetical protein